MSLCLLLLFPPLNFRSRKWFCIKEFPQCWPKLDSLPQKCSASQGWGDNAPPGACHVDGAARLQYPQDMFFSPSVSLLLIYLAVYFTPITVSVRRDTVSYWSLICPTDDVVPCLFFSPSTLLVVSALPFILSLLPGEEEHEYKFFFNVSRI